MAHNTTTRQSLLHDGSLMMRRILSITRSMRMPRRQRRTLARNWAVVSGVNQAQSIVITRPKGRTTAT